jgi:solute carrier family 35, member F1/2
MAQHHHQQIISTSSSTAIQDDASSDEPPVLSLPNLTPPVHTIPWLPRAISPILRVPWWQYLGMSILDVFPNILTLLSIQYTSLTSTTLLGSLTVPATMIFTKLILSKTFRPYQYVGVACCVFGGALTLVADASSTSLEWETQSILGDLLAIAAAIIYGLGDAIAEYSVKRIDRFEYLGMLGLFGAILTGCLCPILEADALRSLFATSYQLRMPVFGLFSLYVGSVLAYYMTMAKFLVSSEATLLNLSLQTVNLWAVLFTWATNVADPPPGLFYVSLTAVTIGVFTYELGLPGSSKSSCRRRHANNNTAHADAIAQDDDAGSLPPPVLGYQTLAQRPIV